jgi:hypothetical protein
MSRRLPLFLVALACLALLALPAACGKTASSSSTPAVDDDASPVDDDDNDDNDDNDDASPGDDDLSPTDDDDDATPDNYLAPWPQSNVEPRDYNESGDAGPLRQKAQAYDAWHIQWHQPFYGGSVITLFTDATRTTVASYTDEGDSSIWTGTFLGSEAMRYYVTNDADAKTDAIAMVATLDGHLQVTGRPGFIARYRAPKDSLAYPGDAACEADSTCHVVTSGPYAGDFWYGATSRDQYTGWMFGMVMAYDLLDDAPTKKLIVADVTEVVHALIQQNWLIVDVNGQPSATAPEILLPMQITWLTIAYHLTGSDEFATPLKNMLLDKERILFELSTLNIMNRYLQYYGNNLSHTNWYTLLRLGKVYFSAADYDWFQNLYVNTDETFAHLSHNAWFNGIYMSQGPYAPSPGDPCQTQLVQDLTAFFPAPNVSYALPARTGYTLDPMSVFLYNVMTEYPILQKIMGYVQEQAEDAFPVPQQCSTDFLWQRDPFVITACGVDDPAYVNPGVDYLIGYWLAEYHKYVTKDM